MLKKYLQDFSIEQIANSGQCFRITNEDSAWKVIAYNHKLYIEQVDEEYYMFHCSEKEYKDIWFEYFDLSRDYRAIKQLILDTGDNT